ncbi:hypothetical protein BD410DRAFT_893217 [Rickenella mellea]|uniref:WW domain-containing protein n=1 Tax=Rickenella mellea TaxID=50990 RepID=A0A4R5XFV5_9AGAM|nr:hypothetical protein BD410DRAFT_893217 [Rickenella mellea]
MGKEWSLVCPSTGQPLKSISMSSSSSPNTRPTSFQFQFSFSPPTPLSGTPAGFLGASPKQPKFASKGKSKTADRWNALAKCHPIDRIDGWERYVVPEGDVYWYHSQWRVVTPSDATDPEVREKIQDERQILLKNWGFEMEFPVEWELMIRVYGAVRASRFMDHKRRRHIPADPGELPRHIPESNYWIYVSTYPMHLVLPIESEDGFLTSLDHGSGDRVVRGRETVFPLDGRQCTQLRLIYKVLRLAMRCREPGVGRLQGTLNWLIALTMIDICSAYERHKFGTSDVREERDHPRTLRSTTALRVTDAILGFLLFGLHHMYRQRLEGVRSAEVEFLHTPDFQRVHARFLKQWADSNLLATVFISANTAFLQIPAVTGLQKTAFLASIMLSILSILAGVHHTWQHRTKLDPEIVDYMDMAFDYNIALRYINAFDVHLPHEIGITFISSLLSLPIVFLLWSVVSFGVALCAYFVQDTPHTSWMLLTIVATVLTVLTIITIVFFRRIWADSDRLLAVQ